jgi:bacillithiol synthase
MEVLQLQLASKNNLVNQYIENNKSSLFHYNFRSDEDLFARYDELMNREFPRRKLAIHIKKYMKKFAQSREIDKSLERLEQPDSVVVIGGQQAGLLTGPLYTIHKIISIINYARQKEAVLGKPIVPIFWIAGEDHDIFEVNHVYKLNEGLLSKTTFHQKDNKQKRMVSKVSLNKQQLKKWYRDVIASFGETPFTKDVLDFLDAQVQDQMTYTDFFAKIITALFKDYGLLLVDSAHPELRKIEQPYFKWMIDHGEVITDLLLEQQHTLHLKGYKHMIESDKDSFQLFYEQNDERILLRYNRDIERIVADGVTFAKSDLLRILEQSPEKFSNNVVTRPLMQEFLFPTLAFIAGPGEISYWAELKNIFELAEIKIPIIVPRMNITYLERNVEAYVKEFQLKLEDVLKNGVAKEKELFVESLKEKTIEDTVAIARKEILQQYKRVYEKFLQFDKGMLPIIEKNAKYITNQLDYLLNKADELVKQKNHHVLSKYDRIELALLPFGGLQERCWNIFYFLNKYGLLFINRVQELPLTCNGNHFVIKM